EIADIEGRLGALTARLNIDFPDYAALAAPKPLKAEEVKPLLGPEEALVFLLPGNQESYVFALTREGFGWKTIGLGGDELVRKVIAFRRGLDVGAVDRMFDKIDQAQARGLFDLGLAHELHGALLGPVETLIKDKSHLIVVPAGVLTAL